MKRALVVLVVLVLCGGIGMGVRTWMSGSEELEVITVVPPTELVPLAETVTVDTTGLGTCPGFTVQAPGQPLSPPIVSPDGTAALVAIMLDDAGSALLVGCEGRVADRGSPRDVVAGVEDYEGYEPLRTVVEVRAGFPEIILRDVEMSGYQVSDRLLEHDGWLYVVGFMRKPEQTAALEPLVETMLLGWTWS